MYMNNHIAKHFVLQLGSLISLYLSLLFFLVMSFGFINLSLPDGLENVWQLENAADSIRFGFAMVLVFFPTYLVFTRLVNKHRRSEGEETYLLLTKWLIYLSLLVAGIALLGNLVAVILGFLEGELTTRFILKSATVIAVVGGALAYYTLDAKGYWIKHEKQSLITGAVVSALVIAMLGASLSAIPSPTMIREMKVDNETIGALQNTQWRVEDYYRMNEVLPASLDDIYSEFERPAAVPAVGEYSYNVTGEQSYELCATFNHPSNQSEELLRPTMDMSIGFPGGGKNYDWSHPAGEYCFERVVMIDEYRM